MQDIIKLIFMVCSYFIPTNNSRESQIFPLMTNQVTGYCADSCYNEPIIIYRYFGKDTIINSRSIGNTTYQEKGDTIILNSHLNSKYRNWFPDSIIYKQPLPKKYQKICIGKQSLSQEKTWEDIFFIREELGNIVMHCNETDSLLNFDQLLFYYNAKIKTDKWEIKHAWYEYTLGTLQRKEYQAELNDTLYLFRFAEKLYDHDAIYMYVSKKYGIVGYIEFCYTKGYSVWFRREVWYSPY